MKKIQVVNNTLTITSDLKVEEIVMLQAYKPEALVLSKEVEGDLIPVFKVAFNEYARPDLSEYGITFQNKTESGFASTTIAVAPNVDAVKYAEEELFGFVNHLVAVEKQAAKAIVEIAKQRAAVKSMVNKVDTEA